jgi:hypothetical protein
VSFATDGDSTEELETAIRRPISVAQLLEREGFRPASRARTTRRALSGVAAGAVLTVGAVVGGLFLNHGQTSGRDTLATAGLDKSGGDVVLSESNGGAIVSPALPHQAGQPAPITAAKAAAPKATGHAIRGASTVRPPIVVAHAPAATRAAPPAAPTAPAAQSAPVPAPASTPAASPSNSSTQTSPSTSTSTTPAPTSTTPAPTSTDPAPTSTDPTTPTTTPDHGGLLGGLTGALGQLQSGFDWFG